MDRSEHYIPENMNPIFKYPLRLDGIIISIREKGSAKVNINLREYDIEQNDLIICAPAIFYSPCYHRAFICHKCF